MRSFEVDTPILNSPYEEPIEHWLRDRRCRLFFAQLEAAETVATPDVAVKLIDDRGNELFLVTSLDGAS